jgi:hypothetical protein
MKMQAVEGMHNKIKFTIYKILVDKDLEEAYYDILRSGTDRSKDVTRDFFRNFVLTTF